MTSMAGIGVSVIGNTLQQGFISLTINYINNEQRSNIVSVNIIMNIFIN